MPSVRVLSRLFRRLFIEKLLVAHKAGKLRFFGDLAALAESQAFVDVLAPSRRAEWVVFAKRPFAGPTQVLAYLSRYTHRIAISNRRLISVDDSKVTFTWKDHRNGAAANTMTLAVDEFMRRFLLHVLPDGFQRIRHYGFLANGHRRTKITLIRELLGAAVQPPVVAAGADDEPHLEKVTASAATSPCPCCGGTMAVIEILPGPRRHTRNHTHRRNDTS